MKIPSSAALCLLFVIGFVHGSLAKEAPRPAAIPSFTVTCRLIDRTKEDETPRTMAPPKISVLEGKTSQVLNQVQRPFVVAASPIVGDDNVTAHQPVIAVISEGITVDFRVNTNGNSLVTLDVTIEEQTIERVDIKDVVPGKVAVQSPKLHLTKQRVFELIKLGQPTSIALDGKDVKESKRLLEFVVTQDKP
jgi:hypothetical protein